MLSLVTSLLIRCQSCSQGAEPRSFPLCSACLAALRACPPLCSACGGPDCGTGPCLRPWVRDRVFASISGQYLGTEPGYTVLKRWKVAAAPLFDTRVLSGPPRLPSLPLGTLLVPVPQSFARAWRLGGSPALRIADWLSRRTGLAARILLESPVQTGQRQGELRSEERVANRLRFRLAPGARLPASGTPIVLIDDILTTGHTMREAADALRPYLPGSPIHAYSLVVRPRRESGAQRSGEFSPPSAPAAVSAIPVTSEISAIVSGSSAA